MSAAAQPGSTKDTFAEYLARYFVLKRGFSPGTTALGALPLAEAGYILLTKADGFTFALVCIVDRERDPEQRFGLSADAAREIAQDCVRYTGTVNRQKLPATLAIYEVGAAVDCAQERARLAAYKRTSIFSKGIVTASLIDTSARTMWTNARWGGLGARAIERMLREPRQSDEQLRRPAVSAPLQGRAFPWLTWSILGTLLAIFVGEMMFRIGSGSAIGPDVLDLIAFGGLQHSLVLQQHEWFRLLSAPLLHADVIHIAMNGIALLLVGYVLERMIGRAWFAAMFVLGAVAGSAMSLLVNSSSMVSVGASGAIMSLFAFAFVCSFHFPDGAGRAALQITLLRVLVPSLLPLAAANGHKVDIAAHLGGALAGAVAAMALLKSWDPEQASPPGRALAVGVALLGAAGITTAMVQVGERFPKYQLAGQLIPSTQVPKDDAQGKKASEELVRRFPRDPRAHIYRAMALSDAKDLAGAEQELRTALQDLDVMQEFFKPDLRVFTSRALANVLAAENRPDEGRLVALAGGAPDWQPPAPPAPLRMRSMSEIDAGVSRTRSATAAIFAEYNSRVKHFKVGSITLSLTVAPDGAVSECHVASSTYNDAKLETDLAAQMRTLRFSPNDPRDTTSHTYTVTFGRHPSGN